MNKRVDVKETTVGKDLRRWTPEDVALKPDEACRVIHLCANMVDDLIARLSAVVNGED